MKIASTAYIGFIALLCVPTVGAGVDIYVPSLPAITHHFMVNKSWVQLSLSTYLIGYGLLQLLFGPLSDSVGRKWVLLLGAFGFSLFGFLSTKSHTITQLLLLRFAQGAAGSAMGVVARALLPDVYQGKQYAKMAAYFVMCWGLGPILAPLLGGYLQHHFNWHAPLYFLSAYGLLICGCALFMPETLASKQVFYIGTIKKNLTAAFCNQSFVAFVFICIMTYAMILIFNAVGPYLVQTVLHFSAFFYGQIALTMGIAWFLGNSINRLLLAVSAKKRTLISTLVGLIAAGIMVLLSLMFPIKLMFFIVPTWLIVMIGGVLFPTGFSCCLNSNPSISGAVSAAMGVCLAVGPALIVAGVSTLKAHNALPMSLSYFVLLVICLIVYYWRIRHSPSHQ